MKTKMLIFVFLLGITDLFAQTLYVPGAIVKGKNASYYCAFENKLVVRVYNVNNVDTTTTMYYDDGTVVPYYVGLGGTIATKTEDLVRVFQEALTQEEIDILKNKITCSLQLNGHRYAPTPSPYPTQESIQLQVRQRISSLPDL